MLPILSKRKSERYLDELDMLLIEADAYSILNSPKKYHHALIQKIKEARFRIYLVALYLENDAAGIEILNALYEAKTKNQDLEVIVVVDWNRAQRGRIGEETQITNANFYHNQNEKHAPINIPFYGVPINYREVLGVLHLKGSVIDDDVLYTGASINNVYLNYDEGYRLDRYHFISDTNLADSFTQYVQKNLLDSNAVNRLDSLNKIDRKALKPDIKKLRSNLAKAQYHFLKPAQEIEQKSTQIQLRPLAGLGKDNLLNKTILHLIQTAQKKLIICTPYFNLPKKITKNLTKLLRQGRQIEIIVGDKTANDFFIPETEPFKAIGGLPYLYEINLRRFAQKLHRYLNSGQLMIRLWKDGDNSYHLKGLWIDNEWMLITGNNLNPRGWRLDLENGILVRDRFEQLRAQREQELDFIREKTTVITNYKQIQSVRFYPKPVKTLIKRLSRIKVDAVIKQLL